MRTRLKNARNIASSGLQLSYRFFSATMLSCDVLIPRNCVKFVSRKEEREQYRTTEVVSRRPVTSTIAYDVRQ